MQRITRVFHRINILTPAHAYAGYGHGRSAVEAVELARQHAARVRLVILDIAMPRMDGNLAAIQIRTLAPRAPILPFSAHEQSWPMLLEVGCLQPIRKHPDMVLSLGRLMRQALASEVAPLPDRSWIRA